MKIQQLSSLEQGSIVSIQGKSYVVLPHVFSTLREEYQIYQSRFTSIKKVNKSPWEVLEMTEEFVIYQGSPPAKTKNRAKQSVSFPSWLPVVWDPTYNTFRAVSNLVLISVNTMEMVDLIAKQYDLKVVNRFFHMKQATLRMPPEQDFFELAKKLNQDSQVQKATLEVHVQRFRPL